MGDDAYEFLGPDLLAPPPPAAPVASPVAPGIPGAPITPETQKETNELAPVSAAEKFQVQPAPATKCSTSKSGSKESSKKKKRGKKTRRHSKRSEELTESLPSLKALKWLMIFNAILIFISVALTLMVLIDNLM